MKAAATVSEKTIELVEMPEPSPGPGQVVVEPEYVGICGSDVHIYRGEFAGRVEFPRVQGHEFAGRVAATGSGVTELKEGDLVCVDPIISCRRCPACVSGVYNACRTLRLIGVDLDGGLAERVCADTEQCFLLPEGLGSREGALVELFSIGMHATTISAIEPGDRVVVIGSGRVGQSVLQNVLLTAAEKVAVVDVSAPKLETARGLGADLAVDPAADDAVEAVLEWTDGDGADCVIECVGEAELTNIPGGLAPVAQAVEMISNGGRITLLGQGPYSYGAHWKTLVWKEAVIRTSRTNRGEFPRVLAMLAADRYDTEAMLSGEFPLDRAAEAFSLVDSEPPDVVKIMVRVSG